MRKTRDWFYLTLLCVIAVVVIFPFFWIVVSSFKSNLDFVSSNAILPKVWTIKNYIKVFTEVPMLAFFKNSMFVTVLSTIGCIMASAVSAFVFAKLIFKGRDFLFGLLLLAMMVPGVVTLIPLYLIFRDVGLINHLWALILPTWTGSAFGIFFLRQHMMSIPHELYESGKLDGCSPPRILWSIYLPMSAPALATLAVLNFMGYWNDLLGPLIFLNTPDKMTVTVGLTYFMGQNVTDYPTLLAGVLLSLIPTFILFLFAQKYIKQGMLISGLK